MTFSLYVRVGRAIAGAAAVPERKAPHPGGYGYPPVPEYGKTLPRTARTPRARTPYSARQRPYGSPAHDSYDNAAARNLEIGRAHV